MNNYLIVYKGTFTKGVVTRSGVNIYGALQQFATDFNSSYEVLSVQLIERVENL